jgi:hypothetical protein
MDSTFKLQWQDLPLFRALLTTFYDNLLRSVLFAGIFFHQRQHKITHVGIGGPGY